MRKNGVIAAIARTLAYLALGGFYVCKGTDAEAVNAIIVGGVFADYVTWAMRTLLTLPGNVLRGSYEACVNAFFGWFVYRYAVVETNLEGEAMAMAFLAFMLVMGIKLAYYGAVYFDKELEDSAPDLPESLSVKTPTPESTATRNEEDNIRS